MVLDYHGQHLGEERTYLAATASTFAAPAGTKAFFVLMGSSTKTIRITSIHMSGFTLTASAYNNIVVRKISTAPTGGTPAELVKVPADSANPSSTASLCQVYTAEPTDGTLVGTLHSQRLLFETTNPAQGDPEVETHFNFKPTDSASGIILRGTSEGITCAFGTTPSSAVTMSLEVEWSEI